jgi:hypothetical protein
MENTGLLTSPKSLLQTDVVIPLNWFCSDFFNYWAYSGSVRRYCSHCAERMRVCVVSFEAAKLSRGDHRSDPNWRKRYTNANHPTLCETVRINPATESQLMNVDVDMRGNRARDRHDWASMPFALHCASTLCMSCTTNQNTRRYFDGYIEIVMLEKLDCKLSKRATRLYIYGIQVWMRAYASMYRSGWMLSARQQSPVIRDSPPAIRESSPAIRRQRSIMQ